MEVWEQQMTECERQEIKSQRKRRAEEQDRGEEGQSVQMDDLYRIKEKAANLEGLTKETVNTKVEIKKAAIDLLKEVARVVNRAKTRMADQQGQGDQEEINKCKERRATMVDQETQTPDADDLREELTCIELRKKINSVGTTEELLDVMKEQWPKRMYSRTRIVRTSILSDKDIRLVVINENSDKDKQVLEQLELQFSALKGLVKGGDLQTGEIATINRKENAKISGRADTQSDARVLLLSKVRDPDNPLELAQILKNMIDQVSKMKLEEKETLRETRLSCYTPWDLDPQLSRKIIECYLWGKNMNAEICLRKRQGTDDDERPPKPSTETIYIKNKEGHTYADTLKTLKDKTSPDEVGVAVQSVMKTKSGDLIMRIRAKKEGGREEFTKLITERTSLKPEIGRAKRIAILFKDLDDVTTVEDIRKALETFFGKEKDLSNVEIAEPRQKQYGGQTARLIMGNDLAVTLLQRRRIKIGWTHSRVIELVRPACCRKCQRFGHKEQDCTGEGPPQDKRCFKCGKNEHLAKECQSEAKCYVCGGQHRANSMACPEYRAEVREARKARPARDGSRKGAGDKDAIRPPATARAGEALEKEKQTGEGPSKVAPQLEDKEGWQRPRARKKVTKQQDCSGTETEAGCATRVPEDVAEINAHTTMQLK